MDIHQILGTLPGRPDRAPPGARDVSTSEARRALDELIHEVDTDSTVIFLTRHNHRVAVLMPPDMGELYERMDEDFMYRQAQEVLDSEDKDDWVSHEDAMAEIRKDQGGTDEVHDPLEETGA